VSERVSFETSLSRTYTMGQIERGLHVVFRSPGATPAENGNLDSNYDVFVGVAAFWAHARWAMPAGRLTVFSFSSILWAQ